MSMGKLLSGLPSEARVHIFCLALDPTTAGALLRDWLILALVSQDLPSQVILLPVTWLNISVLRRWVICP